jgi:hypothetical protein
MVSPHITFPAATMREFMKSLIKFGRVWEMRKDEILIFRIQITDSEATLVVRNLYIPVARCNIADFIVDIKRGISGWYSIDYVAEFLEFAERETIVSAIFADYAYLEFGNYRARFYPVVIEDIKDYPEAREEAIMAPRSDIIALAKLARIAGQDAKNVFVARADGIYCYSIANNVITRYIAEKSDAPNGLTFHLDTKSLASLAALAKTFPDSTSAFSLHESIDRRIIVIEADNHVFYLPVISPVSDSILAKADAYITSTPYVTFRCASELFHRALQSVVGNPELIQIRKKDGNLLIEAAASTGTSDFSVSGLVPVVEKNGALGRAISVSNETLRRTAEVFVSMHDEIVLHITNSCLVIQNPHADCVLPYLVVS